MLARAFPRLRSAVGKTVAVAFDRAEEGLERNGYGWSLEASRGTGGWLMIMMAFGAVITQYAIALELRLAYCGLQDTNLDLQVKSPADTCICQVRHTCGNFV